MKYVPLPDDGTDLRTNIFNDWRACESRKFTPTARQQIVIDAYIVAEAKGLFYTSEILKFAIEHLEVTPEVAAVGTKRVEGGDVGMDMYYSRKYVEAQRNYVLRDAAMVKLNPVVGMQLGTLEVNGLRTNCCMITEITDDFISFSAKRGAKVVSYSTIALQLIRCSELATEKKWRKAPLV